MSMLRGFPQCSIAGTQDKNLIEQPINFKWILPMMLIDEATTRCYLYQRKVP